MIGEGVYFLKAFGGAFGGVEHQRGGGVRGEIKNGVSGDKYALESSIKHPVRVLATGHALNAEGAKAVAFTAAKVGMVEFVHHSIGLVNVIHPPGIECHMPAPVRFDSGVLLVR